MIQRLRTTAQLSSGWIARANAANQQAISARKAHSNTRAIYADNEVRITLEAMFDGKCAYCESKIAVTADWDVEHYRPKGAVAERADHPGYYWLCCDWENLLPSCTYCNQGRKDRATLTQPEGPTAGKADKFPLLDEADRCMDHVGDIAREQPYLIHPILEDPEKHIAFQPDGMAFGLSARGKRTIEICHLNRKRLRDARGKVILEVLLLISLKIESESALQGIKIDSMLVKRAADEAQFAAVAREVLSAPARF